jgi:hypothetical protein
VIGWLSGSGLEIGNFSEISEDRTEADSPEGAIRFQEQDIACDERFQPGLASGQEMRLKASA